MHWFSEYSPDVSREVFPQAIVGVLIRPKIPPLLRDNLFLSFALHLVFFYSLVLIDLIHQLVHTGGRLASQGFPQAMLD